MIEIYVASSYSPSRSMGGWGFVLVDPQGQVTRGKGPEQGATQNQMVLRAAIEGLSKTEQDCEVKLLSNSEYLILGINDSRQRRANRDLWEQLDELVGRRHVQAARVEGGKYLREAQALASEAIKA